MSGYPNFTITDLTPLAEVHNHILYHLKILVPAKLLRLNHTYYEELLPVVYETLSLSKTNVRGILAGWEATFRSNTYGQLFSVMDVHKISHKTKALGHVKNVYFADWTAVSLLYNIYTQVRNYLEEKVVFPNVHHLHISSQVVIDRARTLSSAITEAEYNDWVHSGRSDDWVALTRSWQPLSNFLSNELRVKTITIDAPYHWRNGSTHHIGHALKYMLFDFYRPCLETCRVNFNVGRWQSLPILPSLTLPWGIFVERQECFSFRLTTSHRDEVDTQKAIHNAAHTILTHYRSCEQVFSSYLVYDAEEVCNAIQNMDQYAERDHGDEKPSLMDLVKEYDGEMCACERAKIRRH